MAGLPPPVEMPMVTGPRRTTEGRMKSQCAGSSAQFTQIPRLLPSALIVAFAVRSSVATSTTVNPSMSPS